MCPPSRAGRAPPGPSQHRDPGPVERRPKTGSQRGARLSQNSWSACSAILDGFLSHDVPMQPAYLRHGTGLPPAETYRRRWDNSAAFHGWPCRLEKPAESLCRERCCFPRPAICTPSWTTVVSVMMWLGRALAVTQGDRSACIRKRVVTGRWY